MKENKNKKLTMITCYDYTSARILDATEIDFILVGDSGAMTMHGYDNTLNAKLDMMISSVSAVAKGTQKFIIADLPFLTYRKSLLETMTAVEKLIQAGAQAIKLEGADGNLESIRHIVASGVPVMGHLGLMPQFINALGGFKVQGKTEAAQLQLSKQAQALEAAGCFSIVLECIPAELAEKITQSISIPTIGIGAGPHTSGQVLVWQDLLGLQIELKPKYLKHYLNGYELIKNAINQYVQDVKEGNFPTKEHCY